jgi:RNA polymerase sporulation-specific sigma factor
MTGETLSLLEAAQRGDQAAAARMLEENERLIWSVVRRYTGRGVETEDLFQLGCIGFLKAMAGFDTGYGTQFSTYAVPKIAGEIRRFLRDDGAVKVSRGLKEQAGLVRLARERLSTALGREPTLSELSEETGLDREEIAAAETAAAPVASLQMKTGDGLTLESTVGEDGMEEGIVEQVSLREAIRTLPERERTVIVLRYYRGMTQERVARILGVSQVQVSRIEKKAMGRLRECLGDGGDQ